MDLPQGWRLEQEDGDWNWIEYGKLAVTAVAAEVAGWESEWRWRVFHRHDVLYSGESTSREEAIRRAQVWIDRVAAGLGDADWCGKPGEVWELRGEVAGLLAYAVVITEPYPDTGYPEPVAGEWWVPEHPDRRHRCESWSFATIAARRSVVERSVMKGTEK